MPSSYALAELIAHSENGQGETQSLEDHLRGVGPNWNHASICMSLRQYEEATP